MASLTAMAETVGGLLKARQETVAVAESSTGGLIAAALLAVPGASAYFRGGVVTYTRESRKAYIEQGSDPFAGVAPSSEAYALVLARRARETLGTTWAIGETGAYAASMSSRYNGRPAAPQVIVERTGELTRIRGRSGTAG